MTALTAPELVPAQDEIILGGSNPRLWAGLPAVIAAVLWRNTLLTIGCRFPALFALQRI